MYNIYRQCSFQLMGLFMPANVVCLQMCALPLMQLMFLHSNLLMKLLSLSEVVRIKSEVV